MDNKSEQKEFEDYMIASLVRGRHSDIALGFLIYNLFLISDWYFVPDKFFTIFIIRLLVTSLWLLVLWLHDTPLIQNNLRRVYVSLMFIVLSSLVLFYGIAFGANLPHDITLAAMILTFCLSAFHIPRRDALIVGVPYVLGFYFLIHTGSNSLDIRVSHTISFAVAFVVGLLGATVRERYSRRAFMDDKRLREETNRADNLLVRTFPFEVAKELKFNNRSQARRYDDVTVMFCDIVNFTEISANLPPEDLVDWLNTVFSSFDQLVAECGCEKIKTIGDAYMAVCGAPNPAPDHAERVVKLALAIRSESERITLNGLSVRLRIGINSGPIVAGVIGQSRFAYDLWGDTVNTASRMESLAPNGGILITETTKRLIEKKFRLDQIPSLAVKGKGLMEGWLVIGPQTMLDSLNSTSSKRSQAS